METILFLITLILGGSDSQQNREVEMTVQQPTGTGR
jgi:hypothetical protein